MSCGKVRGDSRAASLRLAAGGTALAARRSCPAGAGRLLAARRSLRVGRPARLVARAVGLGARVSGLLARGICGRARGIGCGRLLASATLRGGLVVGLIPAAALEDEARAGDQLLE